MQTMLNNSFDHDDEVFLSLTTPKYQYFVKPESRLIIRLALRARKKVAHTIRQGTVPTFLTPEPAIHESTSIHSRHSRYKNCR